MRGQVISKNLMNASQRRFLLTRPLTQPLPASGERSTASARERWTPPLASEASSCPPG